MLALSFDAVEHHGEVLTPVDRRVGCPSKDRVNLIPDGLPLGALTSEVEFGQHAFEPIDHFRAALKPWISATLFKKGFNLVHHALPGSSRCRTIAGLFGFLIFSHSVERPDR
jgi:hypothetical protein